MMPTYVDELRIRDAAGRRLFVVDLVADAGRERVAATYLADEAHAAAAAWRHALQRPLVGRSSFEKVDFFNF